MAQKLKWKRMKSTDEEKMVRKLDHSPSPTPACSHGVKLVQGGNASEYHPRRQKAFITAK